MTRKQLMPVSIALVLALVVLVGVVFFRNKQDAEKKSSQECRVGLVLPTTGGMAQYGAEGVIAARIALKDQQKGRNVRLYLEEQDSASEPSQTNAAATVLLTSSDPVQILVGEISSDNTAAMVSQARLVGVPIIAPTASMITLTSMSDRIFRIWPSDAYEARRMKDHIVSKGIKRVGVLFIEVPYGEEMAKYFSKEYRKSGGEAILEGYRKETLDFKPLLQRVHKLDALYIISYLEDAALLLKQSHELQAITGHGVQIFGTSVLDSPKLVDKAGAAAEGVVFAVVEPGDGGESVRRSQFVSEYKKARLSAESEPDLRSAAKEPTFAGFHVYDAVSLAFSACDRASSSHSPATGAAIMNYLRSMPPYAGLTGEIKFDDKGDLAADRHVVFKKIEHGKIGVINDI